MATLSHHKPEEHALTVDGDGHFRCSCGQWGSALLGSINGEYCRKHGITEYVIRRWHASHLNALVIELAQ